MKGIGYFILVENNPETACSPRHLLDRVGAVKRYGYFILVENNPVTRRSLRPLYHFDRSSEGHGYFQTDGRWFESSRPGANPGVAQLVEH